MTPPEYVTLCCNIVFTMLFNAIDIHHLMAFQYEIVKFWYGYFLTMSKSVNPFLSYKKHVTPPCLYIATCSFNIEEHYPPSLTMGVSTWPTVSSFGDAVVCEHLPPPKRNKDKQQQEIRSVFAG